jgi:superfamily II DNA helicase RecQ
MGDGKSAVILASASILQGITLVPAPLLGLGCDQVAKALLAKDKEEMIPVYYSLHQPKGSQETFSLASCFQRAFS